MNGRIDANECGEECEVSVGDGCCEKQFLAYRAEAETSGAAEEGDILGAGECVTFTDCGTQVITPL